jgi:hypothetical protein
MILPVSHPGIERAQRAHQRPHRPLLALASLVFLAAAFAMRTALLASVDGHRAGAALADDLSLLLVRRTG